MKTMEYRCVLVRPQSHVVFALAGAQYELPRVHIPTEMRPAKELQKAIKARWGLNVFVLEIWGAPNDVVAAAAAEVLTPQTISPFTEIPIEQLLHAGFSEQEFRGLELLLAGRTKSPFSQLGWIDEAIDWIESATGCTFSSPRNVEKWNAGGGFTLFRISSDDDRHYWLKATGEPNAHEFALTRLLWELCPDFLPKIVASRKDWNAWLTEDAGDPLPSPPSLDELVPAARRMAQLQLLTIGRTDKLLAEGGFDQRLPELRSHIDAVIAYLIEAMARQTSTKVAALGRDRLLELGEILRDACFCLEALDIPDALIHNDLNAGNILWDGTKYVFVDWSEAAVGNPLLSCERLCQLGRVRAKRIRAVYRDCWLHQLAAKRIDEAIALTPLLAIYAYLYGRGDWLGQTENIRPQFESYARSLARHMDRAAQDLSLLEILCH